MIRSYTTSLTGVCLSSQDLVPRTGELTLGPVLTHEDVVLAIPLAAGSLVVNLNAVAIGILEVDAQGDTVVGQFKLNALLFDMSVELFQVVQAVYPPSHVVEAYTARLDAGSVVADLHKRDFVGLFPVRRHEGGATGNEVISMQAQDVLVPFWESSALRT